MNFIDGLGPILRRDRCLKSMIGMNGIWEISKRHP